jgi:hypothetical protein
VNRRYASLVLPLFIVAVGVGWLRTVQGVLPSVNWLWVLSLVAAGIALPLVSGWDKVTVVAGPFLLISSVFALLRETQQLSTDTEMPCLLIVFGVLLLLSRLLPLPAPKWLQSSTDS